MIFTEEEKILLNKFQKKKVVEKDEEQIIRKFSNSGVVNYCGMNKQKEFTARLTVFGKGLLEK